METNSSKEQVKANKKGEEINRAPPTIAPTAPNGPRAERKDERNKRAEGEPVGVAVLRIGTDVAEAVAGNAPEDHVDYPDDEGDEERERGREGHEYRANAGVGGAAEAEEHGEACEARGDGVEDKDER
ncbi:hypothetical protein M422DRAFT_276872 [Sphaerobolus stellatus SS14]|uniref:Uncharacterized protein n=1 Tax=Sphaerobolus stellatus (strain SS14) TaxID=990650 RepID=A0A0C9TLB8_SPHS4|nr:hypothetical protein M422DRAFT_276872 [Sphaerobolus stellatus SS14]